MSLTARQNAYFQRPSSILGMSSGQKCLLERGGRRVSSAPLDWSSSRASTSLRRTRPNGSSKTRVPLNENEGAANALLSFAMSLNEGVTVLYRQQFVDSPLQKNVSELKSIVGGREASAFNCSNLGINERFDTAKFWKVCLFSPRCCLGHAEGCVALAVSVKIGVFLTGVGYCYWLLVFNVA